MAAGILCKIYIDRACLPHFSSSLSTTYYQVFVVVVVVSVALLQRCHQCCKNKMEQKRQKFSRIAEKFAKYLEWTFLRLLLFIKCTCYSFTPYSLQLSFTHFAQGLNLHELMSSCIGWCCGAVQQGIGELLVKPISVRIEPSHCRAPLQLPQY